MPLEPNMCGLEQHRRPQAPDEARLDGCAERTLCDHYSLPIDVQQSRMVMLAHLAPTALSLQPILAVDKL
eukprot:278044-Prymnesium_polylepis.1